MTVGYVAQAILPGTTTIHDRVGIADREGKAGWNALEKKTATRGSA